MKGEILSLETAKKLKKYQTLVINNQILKNENKRLKEEVRELKNKLRKVGGLSERKNIRRNN